MTTSTVEYGYYGNYGNSGVFGSMESLRGNYPDVAIVPIVAVLPSLVTVYPMDKAQVGWTGYSHSSLPKGAALGGVVAHHPGDQWEYQRGCKGLIPHTQPLPLQVALKPCTAQPGLFNLARILRGVEKRSQLHTNTLRSEHNQLEPSRDWSGLSVVSPGSSGWFLSNHSRSPPQANWSHVW